MAKVEIQIDKLNKRLTQKLKMAQAKAVMETASMLIKEIKDSVSKGLSPVEGQKRYVKYSKSYSDKIKAGYIEGKKLRPVNLWVTGDMIKSLAKKITQKGFKIWFASEIAEYHNDKGAGKSKTKRRLLPTNEGENFSRSITRKLKLNVRKIVFTIFR